MPSAGDEIVLDVGQHRERQVLQVGVVLAPRQVHELVVGADAENRASRSAKSLLSLPNAAISVGQTKVKSLGQKNTTFHLPASLLSETP